MSLEVICYQVKQAELEFTPFRFPMLVLRFSSTTTLSNEAMIFVSQEEENVCRRLEVMGLNAGQMV